MQSANWGPPARGIAANHAQTANEERARAKAYRALYADVFWPTWERYIRHRETPELLDMLRDSQWLPAEQIEAIQLESLRSLLTYAAQNIPYYRELFSKLGFDARGLRSRNELAELPVLTKDIIRERYDDLVDPAHRGKNLLKGTSGSTGTPLKFEYSPQSESWRQAIKIRGYGWAGYRLGDPTFYYWAQVSALPTGARGFKIRFDRALKREVFVDSMNQDEASRRVALDLFRATKPRVLICYTQSCAQFARWILDNDLRDWADLPVLCGAEGVLPADRSVLTRAFGPVFETYGSRETMLIASECDAHNGMHVSEENILVELVSNGRLAGPGGRGDVVVTDLNNYGMPMIRYVNGDIATWSKQTNCACGRGLRLLSHVDGRRADALRDGAGNPVPGIVFHVLFSDARKEIVAQFQAVQALNGEITLKIVKGPDFTDELFDATCARFREYLRGAPFQIEFCEAIPPSSTGKMQTIVVEREHQQHAAE